MIGDRQPVDIVTDAVEAAHGSDLAALSPIARDVLHTLVVKAAAEDREQGASDTDAIDELFERYGETRLLEVVQPGEKTDDPITSSSGQPLVPAEHRATTLRTCLRLLRMVDELPAIHQALNSPAQQDVA